MAALDTQHNTLNEHEGAAAAGEHGETGAGAEHSNGEEGHGAGGQDIHEVPHVLYVVTESLNRSGHAHAAHVIERYENTIYSFGFVIIFCLFVRIAMKQRRVIPGKLQNAVEAVVELFYNFFRELLGDKHAQRFLPFLGSLFLFIICNNYMGLVPGLKAPTSVPQTTFALAACVFVYVQYIGIQLNGIGGYIFHLMGSPRSVVEWCLMPFMFVLHTIGELIKPVSLALRLMGNIMGEDILIFVMATLGTALAAAIGLGALHIGLPLQLPFMFLSLLLGGIQALVFTLLAAIYFLLMFPHEEHHGEEEH
ncbi:F0F1 ATP synthase subunit A [Candidatus Sumerlaeota bacterium]|nr:F0F1 ATP synthase subunit A [Candidatus Sumerlaeota bacterium]